MKRPNLLESPRVKAYLRTRVLVTAPATEPRVALTFDDGPSPGNTPRLLDLLRSKGVRATFFLIGKHARRHPGLVERIAGEGHEIGNHTEHHLFLPALPTSWLRREIESTGAFLQKTTGARPRYVRPPMGWFTDRVLRVFRELEYEPVIGSINPQDYRRLPAERIARFVEDRIEPGAIVILHDGGRSPRTDRTSTLEAVARLAETLPARGYAFSTLSGLAS